MTIDNLKPEKVEVTQEPTPEVEETEENKLMKKSKKELVSMIEAQQIKYKKLRTAKNNQKKELDETLEYRKQDMDTIEKLSEAVALANDESMNMSSQLQLKNSTLKVIEGAVRDYIMATDIAKRNLSKILLSMGVYIDGVTPRQPLEEE